MTEANRSIRNWISGSAYAIYAMLLLSVGLAFSGLLMSSWKVLEELHEFMAAAMLVVIAAHLAGIILHTLRHRENIAASMIHGRKDGEATQGIESSNPLVGAVFLALAVGWTAIVFNGHDEQTGQLTLLGQTFRLGESENEEIREHEDHHDRRKKRRSKHDHHDREEEWRI